METPPPEDLASDLRQMKAFMANLEERLNHATPRKVHKKQSSRRHRLAIEDSETESDEEAPMVSFTHAAGTRPFLSIHERFRAVDVKYFKQIFYGTFRPEHITKLAHSYVHRSAGEDIQEASGMVHLLRCFEVYGAAICHFAHPGIAFRLQEALCEYRIRLAELSTLYRFDTVREYHYAFMAARMLHGQDDPQAWQARDDRCYDLLVRKQPVANGKPYQANGEPKTSSFANRICKNFNEGKCFRNECRYGHICSIC